MESKEDNKINNLKIHAETIYNHCKQLQAIADELQESGALGKESFEKFKQQLQGITHFCNGQYKFSFLVQGEMNAGKSTCLNALLGERILAVSSAPETNFLTCIVYDKAFSTPALYRTSLTKVYDSLTSMFHVNEGDIEDTGIRGTEDIYKHLNGSNQESRRKWRQVIEEIQKSNSNQGISDEVKEKLYKDSQLTDTVYLIKWRVPWLEEKIQDEFILERLQLIDFPGMFEYGHNKITEMYKLFEDNNQGVIHILDASGYESNVITKLQTFQKYPNRMIVIVNKMDQIMEAGDENIAKKSSQEKASLLLKHIENLLKSLSVDAKEQTQQERYLEMSKEVTKIVRFVASKEELMKRYVLKYQNSNTNEEKELYNSILKACIKDDRSCKLLLDQAKKMGKEFAETTYCTNFVKNQNNLFEQIKDDLGEKFRIHLNELAYEELPKQLDSIREQFMSIILEIRKKQKPEGSETDTTINKTIYVCKGCGVIPILPIRYRCKTCENFDFCKSCLETQDHPPHEFKFIPEDFKTYLFEFCRQKIQTLHGSITELINIFLEQIIEELFGSLEDIYKLKDNNKLLEDSLKKYCTKYFKIKEETQIKAREILNDFTSVYNHISGKVQGLRFCLLLMENKNLMMSVFDNHKVTLGLTFAACESLLKVIITTIIKKSVHWITQPPFDTTGNTALISSTYIQTSKIDDSSDLLINMARWREQFGLSCFMINKNLVEVINSVIPKLDLLVEMHEVSRSETEREEKMKKLNDKLEPLLQKIEHMNKLTVSENLCNN